MGTPIDSVIYDYEDYSWSDRLIGYDGQELTLDEIGNLVYDGTWEYLWENGRELIEMIHYLEDEETLLWGFTYNADGMRIERCSDSGTTYKYTYNGSSLSQMTVDNNTLYFAYGANGVPMSVTYNNVTHYYVVNIQGDIIAILNAAGTPVVHYSYDAWGNHLSISGPMANTLGTLNPLRYRGYVYDQETGLYYLQSRYYNPQWGRFLNADSFVSTGQGLLGNNMFAYCNNNPIINSDPTGMLLQKDAGGGYFGGYNGGGGGGLALADPASGHIVRPTTPTSIPLFIPYIPPTTTYDLEILRSEIFFIKKDRQEQVVETQIATLTRPDKKPVVFPENPYDFNPQWLIAIERKGTHNGRVIGWFIPFTKIEVFRWDENLNYSNGPHYHIYGMGHFYPGWTVPEPLASWYFSHLQ